MDVPCAEGQAMGHFCEDLCEIFGRERLIISLRINIKFLD
jgi:hypothetical protein